MSGGRRILSLFLSRRMITLSSPTSRSRSTLVAIPSISNNVFNNSSITSRLKSSLAETTSTSTEKPKTSPTGFEDLDQPIKFTTSKAADWKAKHTHGGGGLDEDMPWIQPYSVTLSVGIFLLYFLAFREENDVDERMKVPLWDRIPGLERQQLEMLLQYNKDRNLPTEDISERLAFLKRKQEAEITAKKEKK